MKVAGLWCKHKLTCNNAGERHKINYKWTEKKFMTVTTTQYSNNKMEGGRG